MARCNTIRLLSLFSGIGAFEKALKNIGTSFELVGYSEIDKYASKAYSLLHDVSEELNLGDINLIDPKLIPDFDLMTYGFPCQSFSLQGKKLGFEDPTKGNLFFESMRIAKEKKPKFMIAENVKGLVIHDNGDTLRTVLGTLDWIGYNNYFKVLNTVDFDLPQSRERIFIVSIRKDIDNSQFEFPVGNMTALTVSDIIDHDHESRHIKDSLRKFLDPKYHKEYKSKNGIKKVFDGNTQGYFDSDFCGKRMYSIYGTCPTLTTKTDAHNFVEIASGLNAKERLRLQGFDDLDYLKIKNKIPEAQIKKQAGNSISVTVLERILEKLFSAMNLEQEVSKTA